LNLEYADQPMKVEIDTPVSTAAGVRDAPPVLIVATGDVVMLLMFAAVGRWSHHEFSGAGLWATLGTAAPFIAGWALAAPPLEAYAWRSFVSIRSSLKRLLVVWPIALIGALLIRSIVDHEIPAPAFIVVAFLFNLLTLSVWRALVVARQRVWSRRAA
jgi:hypothetical protein